jgi:hypothetical protein
MPRELCLWTVVKQYKILSQLLKLKHKTWFKYVFNTPKLLVTNTNSQLFHGNEENTDQDSTSKYLEV